MRSWSPRTAAGPCLGVLVVASLARAQSLIHSINGPAANEQFGAAVAVLGDLDGDGRSEFAVGAPFGAAGAGAVRVYAGSDAHLVWQATGTGANSRFGASLAVLDDWNGDGVAELVVGAWSANVPGASGAGIVRVLSGADGSVILERRGDSPGDHLGWSVADAGDVDGDGLRDWIAGAIDDDDGGTSAGSARVYASGSGATLFTVHGDAPMQIFGSSVAGLGDLDGDGRSEFAAGGPCVAGVGALNGVVRVYSGASGVLLWSASGLNPRDAFGTSIDALGDVDGDGKADLVVGARQVPSLAPGYVRVFDGVSGALVHHVSGEATTRAFGACVRSIGDVDYDGRGDFVVGAPERNGVVPASGAVGVYSGLDAHRIFERTGDTADQRLGFSLAGGRDVDGNGSPDLVAGAVSLGSNTGRALAVSGNDIPPPAGHAALEADVEEISFTANGAQVLTLRAGAAHAGERFLMLGSLQGDEPGIDVGGFHIPLNADAYFLILLRHPQLGPLEPARGWLDSNGEAQVELRLTRPWHLPRLIGHTFHHAYVVFDADGSLAFASNAEACTIVR